MRDENNTKQQIEINPKKYRFPDKIRMELKRMGFSKFMELKPNTSQKSFNGKAMIELSYGCAILYSYNTKIARINHKGGFEKLWSGYSATTMRHIKAFCALYGINAGGKSWWLELPTTKIDVMREWGMILNEK